MKKWSSSRKDRKDFKKELRKYFSIANVKKALSQSADSILKTEKRCFQYVLVNVDDSQDDNTEKLIKEICEIGILNDAVIGEVLSSVIVFYYGVAKSYGDDSTRRLQLVEDISNRFGKSARILHGESYGLVGTFGCSDYFKCGALIPRFSLKLKKLTKLTLGNCLEEKS